MITQESPVLAECDVGREGMPSSLAYGEMYLCKIVKNMFWEGFGWLGFLFCCFFVFCLFNFAVKDTQGCGGRMGGVWKTTCWDGKAVGIWYCSDK